MIIFALMNELKFKTNINCTGCLSKVTPILNAEKNIEKWEVDLASQDRILTVNVVGMDMDAVKAVVQKAGFTAMELNEKVA